MASVATAWLPPGGPWSLSQPRDGQAKTAGTERGRHSLLGPWLGPHQGVQDPPRGAGASSAEIGVEGGDKHMGLPGKHGGGRCSDPRSSSLGRTAKGAAGWGCVCSLGPSPHLCVGQLPGAPRHADQRAPERLRSLSVLGPHQRGRLPRDQPVVTTQTRPASEKAACSMPGPGAVSRERPAAALCRAAVQPPRPSREEGTGGSRAGGGPVRIPPRGGPGTPPQRPELVDGAGEGG